MIIKSGTDTTDAEISGEVGIEVSLNATDVRQLTGTSVVVGGGGDLPGISPGLNYEYAMGENNGPTSHSFTLSGNISVSPAEIHGGISNNKLKWRINYRNKEGEYHGELFGNKFIFEFQFKDGIHIKIK